jgi:GDPmannose 4,6-dehydratase
MWRMVQQDQGGDYILATGETHSVREFVERAFAEAGSVVAWEGSGADEVGRETQTGRIVVRVDPAYFRPTEVDDLEGDPTKAREILGWSHKTTFRELVAEMVAADLARSGPGVSIR